VELRAYYKLIAVIMVFTLNLLPKKVFLSKRFSDEESAIAPGLSCLMV